MWKDVYIVLFKVWRMKTFLYGASDSNKRQWQHICSHTMLLNSWCHDLRSYNPYRVHSMFQPLMVSSSGSIIDNSNSVGHQNELPVVKFNLVCSAYSGNTASCVMYMLHVLNFTTGDSFCRPNCTPWRWHFRGLKMF